MAAIKASPATDEPVKRTVAKAAASPAKAGPKRAAAKSANGSAAPAKRATKTTARAATADSPAEVIEDGASGGAPKKTRTATK
ncbi:MAG: RNA polymerase sigma factor, partial [Mycobacterium sp.]